MYAGLGKKIQIKKLNWIQSENSTKSEPKLIKYPNKLKILVYREPKPNPTRTEIFRVTEYIRNRFIYLNIINIFRFNVY